MEEKTVASKTENNLNQNNSANSFIKPVKEWSKRDSVFAIITVIASICFVSLSLFGGFKLGFTVSFVLLFVFVNLYILKSNRKYTPFSVFCGAAALLLSAVFSIYNNPTVNPLIFAAVFILFWIFLTVSFVDGEHIITSTIYTVIFTPFECMAEPFRSYGKYCNENNKKGPGGQILLGLAISIPVLAVVIPLLIKSDLAFEGLMTSIFSDFAEFIVKIILGVALALYIFSKLFAINKKIGSDNMQGTGRKGVKFLSKVTAVTVLLVLCGFYTVYLISQFAYFFSGFSGILPENYTFNVADYARRGFFELCGVCSINLGILSFIIGFVKRKKENKNYLSVKISSTLICAFSVIFIATAISKMALYIKSFGLTRLRLETSVFMLLLALMFLGICAYIYVKKFPIVKYVVVSTAIIAMLVAFFDVDKTVASYNVNAYNSGILSEIDINHLGTLSDSALPYLEKMLDAKDENVRKEAEQQLYSFAIKYYDVVDFVLVERQPLKWKSYNYSEENAKEIILRHEKEIVNRAYELNMVYEEDLGVNNYEEDFVTEQ